MVNKRLWWVHIFMSNEVTFLPVFIYVCLLVWLSKEDIWSLASVFCVGHLELLQLCQIWICQISDLCLCYVHKMTKNTLLCAVIIHIMRIITKRNYFAWSVGWSEIWWRYWYKGKKWCDTCNGRLENYMYLESTTLLNYLNYLIKRSLTTLIVLSTFRSFVKSRIRERKPYNQ